MKMLLQIGVVLVVLCLISVDGRCQQMMSIDPGGGTPPPDPETTITVSTNTCGEKTLTRSGTPPGGVLWYWQPTPGGTSKVNYSSTYVVSLEGTRIIGLRSYKPSNNTWGGEVYATVTVNLYPGIPSAPAVSDQCGQSIITRGTPPSTPAGTAWYWQGTNPNGTSTGNSAVTYTATASGNYYLRAGTSAGCWSSSVGATVSFMPAPATPPNPSSSGNACGPVTISFNGTPEVNTVWYWQNSASGTSTTLGSATSRVVNSSGTYYLRAYSAANGCWSAGVGQVSVTVNPIPAAPSAPGVSNQCGSSILTYSNSTGNTWYWQGTDPDGMSIANSSTTYTTTSSGTYYLRARSSAGCWSSSVGVEVNFRSMPANPPNPISSGNSCGPVTLSFNGSPGAGTVWYWQTSAGGTSTALGSASTYVANSSGSYYLRAFNPSSACWSSGSGQIAVTVNPVPTPPSVPTVSNQCGASNLTYSNSTGNTWYWQGTNPDGTSTVNSASSYTVTTSGTYYLRARSSAGCWSNSTGLSVTVLSQPAAPPTPSTTGNTCGPVTLSFNGTPPANVRWYWQTSANGTSTYDGFASPKSVTVTGAYYLRAYDTGSECWSELSSAPVSVTYNPTVGSASATGADREEPGIVHLSASPGANGTGVKWYDAASGGAMISESSEFSPVVSTTTTFYVSSYNNSTGCESGVVAVTATVYPEPIINYTSLYVVMGNSVTLSIANNSYTTYSWTRDGVSIGTSPTITVTQPGVYAVSVTKTGMTGTGTSEPVTVAVADMNSIAITSIRKEGVTLTSSIPALAVNEVAKTTSYSGGLGNTLQTIMSRVSTLQRDIIAPVTYDVMGRQLNGYLPYVSATDNSAYRGLALNNEGYTSSEQFQYYQTASHVAHDTKPYSVTDVEASPLGRVLSQTGVGNEWHDNARKVVHQYLFNRGTDGIRIWSITGGLPVSNGIYGDYQLYVRQTTDENGDNVRLWIDKLGRFILKAVQADAASWLQTYYIYDDKGRLTFTLPPAAAGNFSPDQDFLDQWAFQYRYDDFDRLIETKTPAAGWVYTVYDVLNRPVMTQNSDQRSRSEWAFVKYDVHGRAVMTGSKVISSSSRTSVQTSVDAQTYVFEMPASDGVGYTLNRTYPTTNETELLSVSYYDGYGFLAYAGWDAEGHNFAFVPELESTGYQSAVTGLPTGGKIRVIGSNTWLNAVQYYDKHYRLLQVTSENHLGGLDRNTNKYDDVRQLSEARLAHHNGSVIVLRKFQYDHAGRVRQIYQNINNAPVDQLVAQYEYNELGQLIDKKLHNTSGTNFLQSVDFRYNIRGWIASINNAQLNIDSTNNDDTDDFFGMEFLYNTIESGLGNTQYYNGNISAAKWKGIGSSGGVDEQQSYKYAYDKAGRLLNAASQVSTVGTWTKEAGVLNEWMTYDANGNIRSLKRNHGQHQLTGTLASYIAETVDDLTYTYLASGGNQLAKVEDAIPVATGRGDFKNNVSLAAEYIFDGAGNLTADKNKGIDSVHYNILGKVRRIRFSDGRIITYFYDAAGNKLQMKTYQGSIVHTTDYVGGFVYVDGALSFFSSPEGRVVKNAGSFEYQYSISDHQGNTRVVFTSASPAPDGSTATFEGDAGDGAAQYSNIDPSNVVTFIGANHTDAGSKVVRMNQSYKVGPSRSLKVYPGDKVDIEVWEYHEGSSGFGTTSPALTTLITMVSGAFGGVNGGAGESGMIYNGVDEALSAFGSGANQGDSRPAAYLNFILFDQDYNVLDAGWQLAPATTFTKQKLSFSTLNIEEQGYVYVWLSYEDESNSWVYFDDLKVTHTKSNVIQYNEYYPFGLQTAGSWTREDSRNDYLYNAGSELNRNSGWYETFFRGYDPMLGRFHQVDPLAYAAGSHTPYNYAFNNPVLFNDPNGDYPDSWIQGLPKWAEGMEGGLAGGGSYTSIVAGSGNHWSDEFRGVEGNLMLMSRSTFESYYGVDLNTAEGKAWATKAIAAENGANYTWNPYGGNQVTRDQWLALGGDSRKFGDLYFSGGWDAGPGGHCPPGTPCDDGPWIKNLPANQSQNGGDGLSTSFLAGTAFSATVATGRGTLGVINKELAKQNLINNSLKKSLLQRTEFSAVTVPKSVSFVGKFGGYGFTAWSAYDVNSQWKSGQLSTGQMVVGQVSNGIGAIPYMGIGTAWSLGWNLGAQYGPSKWYGSDDTKWFK